MCVVAGWHALCDLTTMMVILVKRPTKKTKWFFSLDAIIFVKTQWICQLRHRMHARSVIHHRKCWIKSELEWIARQRFNSLSLCSNIMNFRIIMQCISQITLTEMDEDFGIWQEKSSHAICGRSFYNDCGPKQNGLSLEQPNKWLFAASIEWNEWSSCDYCGYCCWW